MGDNHKGHGGRDHDSERGEANDKSATAGQPKSNPERSDIKQGTEEKSHHGDTSRSSNQGRKEASGGTLEE